MPSPDRSANCSVARPSHASNSVFSLTTLRQDTEAQAQVVVDSLREILANKAKRTRRHIMPVELIVRESSGPPKAR